MVQMPRYSVKKTPKEFTINITGSGNSTRCFVTIDGTKYTSASSNITATPTSSIVCTVAAYSSSRIGSVVLNGTTVYSTTSTTASNYTLQIPSGISTMTINLGYNATNLRTITITTS